MQLEEFINQLKIRLNQQQMDAVQKVEGAVLLLAVPGSGKTTVLVSHLGYMIYCCGIHPESILTLTYTTAATRDMAARFEKLFGSDISEKIRFSTINSLCNGIIRFFSEQAGKSPFQVESNEKVLAKIISDLYRKYEPEKPFPLESDIRSLRSMITFVKNMQLSETEIEKLGQENDLQFLQIYKEYQQIMRNSGKKRD